MEHDLKAANQRMEQQSDATKQFTITSDHCNLYFKQYNKIVIIDNTNPGQAFSSDISLRPEERSYFDFYVDAEFRSSRAAEHSANFGTQKGSPNSALPFTILDYIRCQQYVDTKLDILYQNYYLFKYNQEMHKVFEPEEFDEVMVQKRNFAKGLREIAPEGPDQGLNQVRIFEQISQIIYSQH